MGKVIKKGPSHKNPYITGLLGYEYAGLGNSIEKTHIQKTIAKTPLSEKDKTDRAAAIHDLAYNTLQQKGHNPYITSSSADQDFIDNSGNDIVGLGGKALFKLKQSIAPSISDSDSTKRKPIDEGYSGPSKTTKGDLPERDPMEEGKVRIKAFTIYIV